MSPENFCYWLRGFYELNGEDATKYGLTKEQADMICKHLSLVFNSVTDKKEIKKETQEGGWTRKDSGWEKKQPPEKSGLIDVDKLDLTNLDPHDTLC